MSNQDQDRFSDDMRQKNAAAVAAAKNAVRTAKKARAVARGGKAVKAVSSTASNVVTLKIKLIALLCFLALALFLAILLVLPSIISNSILHMSDPEQIAAGEDIFAHEDYNTNVLSVTNKYRAVYDTVSAVLTAAYDDAIYELNSGAETDWWYHQPVHAADKLKEEIILLCACYSASMTNASSEASYNHYVQGNDGNGINAIADLQNKLQSLIELENDIHTYGNAIYGADFVKDEFGAVIVTEEKIPKPKPAPSPAPEASATPSTTPSPAPEASTTPSTTPEKKEEEIEYETRYWVDAFVTEVDIMTIARKAFGIPNLAATYDYDSHTSHTGSIPGATYGDVIIAMCKSIAQIIGCTCSEEDYMNGVICTCDEWASTKEDVWATYIGGSANTLVNVALKEVGNRSGYSYCSWFFDGNIASETKWDAIFIAWCAKQSGINNFGSIPCVPKMGTAANYLVYFKSRNLYIPRTSGYVPQPGDLVFFDYYGTGSSGHADQIGIVVASDNSCVWTVQGNANAWPGGVQKTMHAVYSTRVLGYARPRYPFGQGG